MSATGATKLRMVLLAGVVSGVVAGAVVTATMSGTGLLLGSGESDVDAQQPSSTGNQSPSAMAAESPDPGSTTSDSAAGTNGSDDGNGVEFEFEIGETTFCGPTCQLTPVTVTNVGTEPAGNVISGVEVTAGGERIFLDRVAVGTLEPGQSSLVRIPTDVGNDGFSRIVANGGLTYTTFQTYDGAPVQAFVNSCDSVSSCRVDPATRNVREIDPASVGLNASHAR